MKINIEGHTILYDSVYEPNGVGHILWGEVVDKNGKLEMLSPRVLGDIVLSKAKINIDHEKLVIEDYKKGGLK